MKNLFFFFIFIIFIFYQKFIYFLKIGGISGISSIMGGEAMPGYKDDKEYSGRLAKFDQSYFLPIRSCIRDAKTMRYFKLSNLKEKSILYEDKFV